MREHAYRQHPTASSLVAEAATGPDRIRNRKRKLEQVKRMGMWAFVLIPEDEDEMCVVHFWHRKDQDPRAIAMMLGHELGHIADGGPKDKVLGYHGEENRADEFGRAAQEAMSYALAAGLLIGPSGRPLSSLGPSPAGRVRRPASAGRRGRTSRMRAPRARRR